MASQYADYASHALPPATAAAPPAFPARERIPMPPPLHQRHSSSAALSATAAATASASSASSASPLLSTQRSASAAAAGGSDVKRSLILSASAQFIADLRASLQRQSQALRLLAQQRTDKRMSIASTDHVLSALRQQLAQIMQGQAQGQGHNAAEVAARIASLEASRAGEEAALAALSQQLNDAERAHDKTQAELYKHAEVEAAIAQVRQEEADETDRRAAATIGSHSHSTSRGPRPGYTTATSSDNINGSAESDASSFADTSRLFPPGSRFQSTLQPGAVANTLKPTFAARAAAAAASEAAAAEAAAAAASRTGSLQASVAASRLAISAAAAGRIAAAEAKANTQVRRASDDIIVIFSLGFEYFLHFNRGICRYWSLFIVILSH